MTMKTEDNLDNIESMFGLEEKGIKVVDIELHM